MAYDIWTWRIGFVVFDADANFNLIALRKYNKCHNHITVDSAIAMTPHWSLNMKQKDYGVCRKCYNKYFMGATEETIDTKLALFLMSKK